MEEEEWRARLTKPVADQVRRLRLERGLSVQKLADLCVERYGLPMKRSVLANFEGGRRPALSVVELIVLARILEVPPVQLLFPVGREATTEVLPGEPADTWDALRWFTGEEDRLSTVGEPFAVQTEQDITEISLYRQHDRLTQDWWDARHLLSSWAESTPDVAQFRTEPDPQARDRVVMDQLINRLQGIELEIEAVQQEMHARGLRLPDTGLRFSRERRLAEVATEPLPPKGEAAGLRSREDEGEDR